MKQYNQLKANIVLDFYIDEICKFRNVKKSEVLKKGRKREFADIRAMSAYLAKKQCPEIKLHQIANYFKLVEHATALYSLKKIEILKTQDKTIKENLEHCEKLNFVRGVLESNGFVRTAFIYGLKKKEFALTFESFAVPIIKGNLTFYTKTELGEEKQIYAELWNIDDIDIFDTIIIAQNIDKNPLGILINSLKN